MAIRLDGSNTVYWNGQSSLLVFLWHECTSKGITAIKPLFTNSEVDDLPDGIWDFDFTSIHTINDNAYTSDETRQWWALKEHVYRSGFKNNSFEKFEESRIKGTDNLDIIIDNTRYL